MTFRAFSIGFSAAVLALACGSDSGSTGEDPDDGEPQGGTIIDEPDVRPEDDIRETCEDNPLLAGCEPEQPVGGGPVDEPEEPAGDTPADLARAQAANILESNCGGCHGPALTEEQAFAGMNYIDDFDQLVENGKVQPLNSAGSRIIQRMRSGEMPPPNSGQDRVSDAEIDTVASFIDEPTFWPDFADSGSCADQEISFDDVFEEISGDLAGLDEDDALTARYIVLTNRANAHNKWAALLLALPLAILPAACGDDNDRDAATEDELGRELDLALQGDSAQRAFEDTAIGLAPTTDPVPPQPAPTPRTQPRTPQRTPRPTPRPAPASDPAPAPSAPRNVTSTVPSGTTFGVTLNETLSTDKNAAGDGFTATLSEPILDADGNVMIPAGATLRGRVTRVDHSNRVGETAVLNVAFESISFGGRSYGLDASVIEANPERKTRQSTGTQAGKIAAGAAAGAIIGRVLGKDTKSTLKGAAVGAAAGTAIAMGTADVDVVLAAGSAMRVRLDGPITVRRPIS